MKSSITDQFWGGLLKKEPTWKERKSRRREMAICILFVALVAIVMMAMLWAL